MKRVRNLALAAARLTRYVRQKMRSIISFVLLLAAGVPVFGADAPSDAMIENSSSEELSALVGRRVVLEGLAWGQGWKGLGERLILPTGTRVYLSDLGQQFPNGKAVRVTGVLKRKKMSAAPADAQGYSKGFSYWSVSVEKIVQIEAVTTEMPEEAKQ